jgi:hypothetical protein
MFIKLCAARLALALPVTGFETMSISPQGMPKSVVRRVHGSAAKADTDFDDTYSVNGVAVELHSLEKRVETISLQNTVANEWPPRVPFSTHSFSTVLPFRPTHAKQIA